MPDQLEVTMAYNVSQDTVMIKSPLSGVDCFFKYDEIWEFIDWLRSGRYREETWGRFEMELRYHYKARMLVCCEGNGRHVDFFAFSDDDIEFQTQVDAVSEAIRTVEKAMIQPAKEMKAKGMTDDEVIRALSNRFVFDLPALWEANPQ